MGQWIPPLCLGICLLKAQSLVINPIPWRIHGTIVYLTYMNGWFIWQISRSSHGSVMGIRISDHANLKIFYWAEHQRSEPRFSWNKGHSSWFHPALPLHLSWNKGISLTKAPFGGNRSCEVAIIWPEKCTYSPWGKKKQHLQTCLWKGRC